MAKLRGMDGTLQSISHTTTAGLKLALVTETWPPEVNGVAMTLSRLVDGLQSMGCEVSLVRPRQRTDVGGTERELLVPGLPIPGYAGLRFGLPVVGRLRRQWREQRPDVVHIATEGPLGWAALNVARSLNIPVTSTFHTNFHRYCAHYRIGWLRGLVTRHLRTFHNRSAFTMVPNATLQATLREDGYRNVAVLGRGVDSGLFNPAQRNPALRAAWGVGEDDLVVIHVSRLAPEKNLQTVEAAFAAIERRNPRVRMVWVGDGPAMARLRRRYPHHVFAGVQLGQALAEHYASADLFLFASQTETFGNVVPEAMASGLAVVAFDYASAALLIRQDDNGVRVPYGDQQAFVQHAEALALQPDRVRQMGRRASMALAAHSWRAVCQQFHGYLQAAVQGAADAE